jgi:hypothetical protein
VAILSLLASGAESPIEVEVDRSFLCVRLHGFTLWSTRCDRPLLMDQAADEVRGRGRDALILRFATASEHASPLVFDWLPAGGDWRTGLLPALPCGGGLSLVGTGDDGVRLDLRADAIVVRDDMPPVWDLQRDLAIARASAVLNNRLWGGL